MGSILVVTLAVIIGTIPSRDCDRLLFDYFVSLSLYLHICFLIGEGVTAQRNFLFQKKPIS